MERRADTLGTARRPPRCRVERRADTLWATNSGPAQRRVERRSALDRCTDPFATKPDRIFFWCRAEHHTEHGADNERRGLWLAALMALGVLLALFSSGSK